MLAEHLTAEYRVKTEGRGRIVDEWKHRANRPDNHYLDCLAGAAVAGAIQGAALPEHNVVKRARKKIKLSEMQRKPYGSDRKED